VKLNIHDALAGEKAASEPGAGAATEIHTVYREQRSAARPTLNGEWPVNTWFQRRLRVIYRLKAEDRFYESR